MANGLLSQIAQGGVVGPSPIDRWMQGQQFAQQQRTNALQNQLLRARLAEMGGTLQGGPLWQQAARGDFAAVPQIAAIEGPRAAEQASQLATLFTKRRAEDVARYAIGANTPEQWDVAIGELSKRYPGMAQYQGRFSPELRQRMINQARPISDIIGGGEAPGFTLGPGQARYSAAGQLIAQGPEKLPDMEKQFDQAAKLRASFETQSKDFVKVRDAYGRIQASATDPSAAGDLSLIFNYMKVLDPGSVVRETEFATAQNAAGVPERIRNIFNKILTGERLSDAQRKDFTDRADKLYKSQERGQAQLEGQYSKLSKSYKLDPAQVIIDYRTAVPRETKPPPERPKTIGEFLGFGEEQRPPQPQPAPQLPPQVQFLGFE